MTTEKNQNKQITDHQEFIVAEFNYIAQSAFQAHEDRARVSEFFLISFGTFFAVLFSSQFSNIDPNSIYILFSILFSILAFWGALTVLELSRLRIAWLESVRAMNYMKDHLVSNFPALDECLMWKTDTIPEPFKLKSVGFLKALEVSVLSGISLGAATSFISLSSGNTDVPWLPSTIIAGAAAIVYLVLFYYLPLRNA